MKPQVNMRAGHRIFYVVVGIALLLWPFVADTQGLGRLAAPLLGIVSLISGASGW